MQHFVTKLKLIMMPRIQSLFLSLTQLFFIYLSPLPYSVFPDLSCRIGGNGNPGLKRKISDPDQIHHDQESVDSNRKRELIGPNEDIDSESKKQKKVRTTFTGRQIFELEKMFETKKYLSSSERTELAKMLNVTEQQVIHLSSS
jgi:hypothetical protein